MVTQTVRKVRGTRPPRRISAPSSEVSGAPARTAWPRGILLIPGSDAHRSAAQEVGRLVRCIQKTSNVWASSIDAMHKKAGARNLDGSVPPLGVPDMMIDLKMKVLPGPGHRDRREAQGRNREGPSEGSVKRNCESTNRNRIRGAVEQGELAKNSEAPVAKVKRRRSGDCAGKANHLRRWCTKEE